MPKKPDPLDGMSPAECAGAMRGLVFGLFGDVGGAAVWRQMEPAMQMNTRQLGDAPEPEKNYWKGVWRIYEIE